MNFGPSHDFLDDLGWTLLHFLWQGLIIAALTAVALRLLRRHSANVRYLAGCFALLMMAAAPVATFYSLNRAEEIPTPKFTVRTFDVAESTVEIPRPTASSPRAAVAVAPKPIAHKTTFPELLEASLPWLVAAWSLGVLALSCRLFAGWLFIQKLRRSATFIEPWQSKLSQLAARIGVSRPIRLLQSACVEVPAVIGWLRPVILLPASCLTGLTPGQLESILAHELAHIRRHDYLVNLLQNVVETLLFYHPAVWWVSRRIRAEREHCCDDLAVKTCGDAAAYARALATLEELRPAPAPFALAAAGAPLLERIRRLAGQPERSAVRPAWPVAGVIALLLLALLAVAVRNNPASAQPAEPPHMNQITSASAPTNSPAATNTPVTQPLVAPFPLAAQTTTTNQPSLPPIKTNSPLNAQPVLPGQLSNELRDLGFLAGGHHGQYIAPLDPATVPPEVRKKFEQQHEYYQNLLRGALTNQNSIQRSNNFPDPQINIKTKWVEIDATMLGTNTFLSFFPTNGSQPLTTVAATFDFADYYLLQPTNLAVHSYAVDLDHAFDTDPFSACFSATQINSAIKKLEQQDGVDILTCPELTTEPGLICKVQAVDVQNLLIGGSPPGKTNGPDVLKNTPFGPVVDLIPSVSRNPNQIDLEVVGTVSEFIGYLDPATVTNENGKPMPKNWAIPHFRSREFRTQVTVTNGQTLVLGAAPVPITTIEKKKDKVPFMADVPLIGRLFRSSKTTTNIVQKSLVLLVTPTLVNPDGTAFVAPPAPERAEPARTADLVEDGKSIYLAGKLDEAEVKLKQAVQTDPSNPVANLYLRLIKGRRNGTLVPVSTIQTNAANPSSGRDAIIAKLNRLHLSSAQYQKLPLPEVVDNLSYLAKRLDPEKTGINFRISHDLVPAPGTIDPATGLPIPPPPPGFDLDIKSAVITIKPPLKNVRFAEVLDAITNSSDVPITYSILDDAVVFSPRNTNYVDPNTFRAASLTAADIETIITQATTIPLETRTFHADPNKFREHLEDLSGLPRGSFAVTNLTNGFSYALSNHSDAPQVSVRKFFSSLGIDFSTNNPANVGKAFVWGDKRGIFTVRATASDLDMIAAAIENLNTQPLQISLKTVIAEIIQQDGPIDFHWGPVDNFQNLSNGLILSEPQFRVARQALEQRNDVTFFSCPEVIAESGRETHIQSKDLRTNAPVTAFGTNFAPALDIIPTVSVGDQTLQLNVVAAVPEFIGFDNPGPSRTDMEGKLIGYSTAGLPHYRLRQATSDVTITDGQTLVMGGMMSQVPEKQASEKEPWNLKAKAPARRKNMMIFVTATLMNPDGTPYHIEQQRLSFQTNAPAPGIVSGSLPAK